MVTETAYELAPEPTALAEARAAVRDWAADALGMPAGEELVDVLQLVVSELVTNAIKHGAGPITLRLRADEGADEVVLGVHDHGGLLPERRGGPDHVPHGRGLGIVEQVARSWEVLRDGAGGKTVWVRFAVLSPSGAGSG